MRPVAERYANFDLFRLLLATEVAFVHVWFTVNPNFVWNPYVMAVPAFLAISGFLVLKSLLESGSLFEFFGKRILRVMPALLFSFFLCLALFDWSMAWNSILNWATGGLYTLPMRANGPLWSLLWEEIAYIGLALLWSVGAYRHPTAIWALLLVAIGIAWANSGLDPHARMLLFLPVAFLVGNLMYIHREPLMRINPLVPLVAIYVMIQWRYVPDAKSMGGVNLLLVQAFAVVWAGIAGAKLLPWRIPDISYGVYIYHWPVLAFLSDRFQITSLSGLLFWTAMILVPLCIFSWYAIERPALTMKRHLSTFGRYFSRDGAAPAE
ncbi:acyltransferase [Mesorhizobium sp. L103C119B0]|uniref:acyltransferase family protein n=1 Tax=Mesorhizobium sp. L103C119B0 TaxID=1287085 RepID=UPI0018CBB383|nr:acyltransferase [Mesorhizobium sp. L103C119B0]